MSRRTLVFVNTREEAPAVEPTTDVVVLDTAWTPEFGERPDLIPVRPSVSAVLDRVNLFDETLERLDAWGETAGMADRLMVDGVSWWFHARSFIRLDLHEMLLWCHVLAELAPAGRYERIELPAGRAFLVAAARAYRWPAAPSVVTYGPPALSRSADAQGLRGLGRTGPLARLRAPVGQVLRTVGVLRDPRPRMRYLEARLATLAAEPPAVLAVVRSASFHVIEDDDGIRRTDPYVTPVLDALAAEGHPVVSIGLALDLRLDADWQLIKPDPRLLPMSFVSKRTKLPSDDAAIGAQARARIMGTPELAVDVEGFRPRVGDPRDRVRPVALVRTPAPRHALGRADHDRAPAERVVHRLGRCTDDVAGRRPPPRRSQPGRPAWRHLSEQPGLLPPAAPRSSPARRDVRVRLVRAGAAHRGWPLRSGDRRRDRLAAGPPRRCPRRRVTRRGHRPAPRARGRGYGSAPRRVRRAQPGRR